MSSHAEAGLPFVIFVSSHPEGKREHDPGIEVLTERLVLESMRTTSGQISLLHDNSDEPAAQVEQYSQFDEVDKDEQR